MDIYYLNLKVQPTLNNEKFNEVNYAFAYCWVKERNSDAAYKIANFYIEKYDWKSIKIESEPRIVKSTDFTEKELGLENYYKALKDGIALTFVAVSRDGKSSFGPITQRSSSNFDLEKYLNQIRENKNRGRCLHFNAGIECNKKTSDAHSIQKSQMLTKISRDGHIYTLNSSIGGLIKNSGQLSYKKTGINVFSTFRGFCQKHDNDLFKSIDTQLLIPNEQQAFLYAYRSLCKELNNKEIALDTYECQLELGSNINAVNESLKSMISGTRFGLKNLNLHKMKYDDSLRNGRFDKIKYLLFISNQAPNVAFSGGIFPDYDFQGKLLQDLENHNSLLEMITFSSAPINSGWAFLFAWHESSSNVISAYTKSLATEIYKKRSVEDFLFRLAITSENHAFAPFWWDNLPSLHKEKIIERTSETVNIFSEVPSNYLMNGVEGICGWKFTNVMQNY